MSKQSEFKLALAKVFVVAASFLIFDASVALSETYTAKSFDKIKIKAEGWPTIDNEYTINSSGDVIITEIGKLHVAELNEEQIARQIEMRLQSKKNSPDAPAVSAEIIFGQPIYVLGDVQKPGEYPFRRNISVLQSISLAGGYFRINDLSSLRWQKDAITAAGEARSVSEQMDTMKLRLSRLQAELAEQNDLNSHFLLKSGSSGNTQDAAAENDILSNNRAAMQKKITDVMTSRELYNNEIQSLRKQIESERRQQTLVEGELSELKALSAKGLGLAPRQLSLERTLAQIIGYQQSLETLILRASQAILQQDQQFSDFKATKKTDLLRDLLHARAEIAKLSERRGTLHMLINEAKEIGSRVAHRNFQNRSVARYVLVRSKENGSTHTDVDEDTLLQPGDVIEVTVTSSKPKDEEGN